MKNLNERVESLNKRMAEYIRLDEIYQANDLDDADAVYIMKLCSQLIRDMRATIEELESGNASELENNNEKRKRC